MPWAYSPEKPSLAASPPSALAARLPSIRKNGTGLVGFTQVFRPAWHPSESPGSHLEPRAAQTDATVKLILSRKGFDSAAGGVPSPIVDGRPVSLPIPTRQPSPTRYRDLAGDIAAIVTDLTQGRITPDHPCHLDPDLDTASLPRLPGWRGALGQVSTAQTHLANHRIAAGDLFLFWGLFRTAIRNGAGRWQFTGHAEHRIFGWLQIDEILNVGADPTPALSRYPWLVSHPHLATGWNSNNTVYVARDQLALPGVRENLPGFGLWKEGLRLTAPTNRQPSTWQTPAWLNPLTGGTGLTYHPDKRWSADNTLRSAARGQEFIADIGERADARDWLKQLFEQGC